MSEFFTLVSLKPPGQQLGSRLHLLHLLLLLLLAQQTHNWRSWGSWLWKCMLVKSSFSFNCICCRFSLFTTWDWECFVIKWWGLGCPAPLHGPGIVPWSQPNWYSIWALPNWALWAGVPSGWRLGRARLHRSLHPTGRVPANQREFSQK